MRELLRWLGFAPRRRASDSVPSPAMREMKAQRDNLYECLRLVDGLLSSGEVNAAQSQVRLTLTAYGRRPTPRTDG